MITPELEDAHGRGSRRVFSSRNFLEFALALQLRSAMLPITTIGLILRVLQTFEANVEEQSETFTLPESLREGGSPDLRIIVSDGALIYFSLAAPGGDLRLFGGVPLDEVATVGSQLSGTPASENQEDAGGFGGPERSRFVRLELSVTAIAYSLELD